MTPSGSNTDRTTTPVGVVVGVVMALASAIIPTLGNEAPDETPPVAAVEALEAPTTTEVESLLDQLQVAPEGPREGYERDAFKHWVDADGDGCDTREEILIEESLVPATTEEAGCSVATGEWLSAYDATTFTAPGGLDIDHMVPLGEAWDSGASGWDSARREEYANDLSHPAALIAVSAGSNRSKSDGDPADWQPPSVEYWCRYASDWVTVKIAWDLSADQAEVEALKEMLFTCEEGGGE
jgi:uncharacterized protein DUF1524